MSSKGKSKRKSERKAQAYERRMRDAGYTIVDGGNILDAPDEHLVQFWHAWKEKSLTVPDGKILSGAGMIAAELVRRGALRGCGCKDCDAIRDDALSWEAHCKKEGIDPRA